MLGLSGGLALLRVLTAPLSAATLAAAASTGHVRTRSFVYGKYYTPAWVNGSTFREAANTYYIFTPQGHDPTADAAHAALPVVLQFHGGGFTYGSATTSPTPAIVDAVTKGMAWISVDYRLAATKYFYDDDEKTEELIHVDAKGRLTLDTSGKTMDDYVVRRGHQELMMKCAYDAAMALEHIIEHAAQLGVDVHRLATTGFSTGGGAMHYLTWVYHSFAGNPSRYTPVGMVYPMAQLDYPVSNIMDRVWGLWADDVGADTKLSAMLSFSACGGIIGNPWCPWDKLTSDYSLCNATHQAAVMARFCDSEEKFNALTLGDARRELVWPRDDAEVGRGMEVLWYNSVNMQRHQPSPFYLYVANALNGTAGMTVAHSALYARRYAEFAEQAGINYTVYYTDYHGMTAKDVGERRFAETGRIGTTIWNYRSSHGWVDMPGARAAPRAHPKEQTLYFCLALGIRGCSASPPLASAGPALGSAPPLVV